MDRFISRKRPRSRSRSRSPIPTDVKLAQLVSLFPDTPQEILLDILTSHGGSVESASSTVSTQLSYKPPKKRATPGTPAVQTSLTAHVLATPKEPTSAAEGKLRRQPIIRKGQTLHLYSPEDVATHTPCTIIHNFLPPEQANTLLRELLDESVHFSRYKFQLFDRTVESPHSTSVYVSTDEEYVQHTSEYAYGGTYRSNVRQLTPHMRTVSSSVQRAVNDSVKTRIREHYPDGKKLLYQSPKEWMPNAAFVNCYDGPAESVGYHSDELTYLGPRAIIGSLSLGVEREFRVRRMVPSDDDGDADDDDTDNTTLKSPSKPAKGPSRADMQGQISIHLPHNSLLIMHAEMQEEWKHAIAPAQTISPHPVSGNRRINITYRWYRESLHPRNTPRCRCGMSAILRCVQRKRESRGRYMWMCYAGFAPGKQSCGFFTWAEFDKDGEPIWRDKAGEEDASGLQQAPILKNFADG